MSCPSAIDARWLQTVRIQAISELKNQGMIYSPSWDVNYTPIEEWKEFINQASFDPLNQIYISNPLWTSFSADCNM